MTTMISIEEVITSPEEIKITGKDLDAILMNGDLDTEFESVSFTFARNKKNEMSYIFKVASKQAKDEKSLQAMLDKLVGAIVILNDNFKVKA